MCSPTPPEGRVGRRRVVEDAEEGQGLGYAVIGEVRLLQIQAQAPEPGPMMEMGETQAEHPDAAGAAAEGAALARSEEPEEPARQQPRQTRTANVAAASSLTLVFS